MVDASMSDEKATRRLLHCRLGVVTESHLFFFKLADSSAATYTT